MARKGSSLSDPNVDKVEIYRAHTTRYPLQMDNVRVPRSLVSGKVGEVKEKIMAEYQKSIGDLPPLRAHGLPEIIFDGKSLNHDFSLGKMSRPKLSIITSHKRMNYLLNKGTVLERRIKNTSRTGNVKGYKTLWTHFWEVRGRVLIGKKDFTYTFSVYQTKGESVAKVYDFKLFNKK